MEICRTPFSHPCSFLFIDRISKLLLPLTTPSALILPSVFQVPALHLCAGPAPALYCTGVDTGIILDIGAREAHVVGVYRGMPLVNSYAGRLSHSRFSECSRHVSAELASSNVFVERLARLGKRDGIEERTQAKV